MKIQVASDLHLDFLDKKFPHFRAVEPTDADVLVIAGDIHRSAEAVAAFANWPVPVIYVHGNHEAYDSSYLDVVEGLRSSSAGSNVHYLEQNDYVVNGVRFLGCCLWTDYQLDPANPLTAMRAAERGLNDHRQIRFAGKRFTAKDALQIHQQSRAWLEEQLDVPFDGPTVVVTHHGPHPQSVHPRHAGDMLNAAFVSDLTPLLDKADLWIHGHVHDNFDYVVGGTRVVTNPRGYALNRHNVKKPEDLEWENPSFDPTLVVEVV